MEVHKSSVLSIFDSKQRLEVPLFQRQYVWNEEQQWQPLWEDIERKFAEALEGRRDAPNHFLGAMVLDQKQTKTGHVVVRQVIDGQQRLTTLQIFLSSYRDFCSEHDCLALAAECDTFLYNTGMMADADVDKFKVWPTQLDRAQFKDVISAGSRENLVKLYPQRKKPYARKFDPRPRMVEAYLFFFDRIAAFFLGGDDHEPIAPGLPLSARVEEGFQALRNALMVVVIDLQKDDDPQVIFETLNARGEPLLPADLLRNYIFLRASRDGLDVESIYNKHWRRFDDEFWREEVKQGRLTRPRSDLFMQHFLASHQGQDIPVKHLYVEYRHWLEHSKPFKDVSEELSTLARQGEAFKRIISPVPGDVIFDLCTFLNAYDIRTAYPLLLALLDAELSVTEWSEVSVILQSYLFRRAVCNSGTQNYNRIFLSLTKNLRKEGFTSSGLRMLLLAQTGESSHWPDERTFRKAWMAEPLYGILNNAKLVYLFERLNKTYMSRKSEKLVFDGQLSIEHILPQEWVQNWPLPNGTKGLEWIELISAKEDDPRAIGTRERSSALQTLGNLTILTTALNSSQSNSGWEKKRPEMIKHSLLPINQSLQEIQSWDEAAILRRGEELFQRALQIWPR